MISSFFSSNSTHNVEPSLCLGPFILGSPLYIVLKQLQKHGYNTNNIISIIHDEENPLSCDILVDFTPEDNIRLRFDSVTQRLRMIDIHDLRAIRWNMSYQNTTFCGPDVTPAFRLIYRIFGPTFPGTFDIKRNLYMLIYPGIAFAFKIPPQFISSFSSQANNNDSNDLPFEFEDGSSLLACRLFLYYGCSLENPEILDYNEEIPIIVKPNYGIIMPNNREITFQTKYTQDILSDMGPPNRVYVKEGDKMGIHSISNGDIGGSGGGGTMNVSSSTSRDYFYNYFTKGMDILIDGHFHYIKKIIFHTNFPARPDFNQYQKANFKILIPEKDMEVKSEEQHKYESITANSRWDDIRKLFGPCTQPMIQSGDSRDNNPFGSTLVYGYPGILFEVMKNGHLASVTLFQARHI